MGDEGGPRGQDMEIKEAGLLDLPKIDAIIVDDRRLFDNPLFSRGEPPNYPTWRGLKRVIKYLAVVLNPRSHLFFLLDGEKVAGTAVVVNRNYIDAFFINQEYRGQGRGRALMEHVLGFIARTSPEAEVRVEEANTQAQEFYRACGFRPKARILSRELRR